VRRLLPLAGAAVLLGGCAHTSIEDGADDYLGFAARQERLAALDRWNLNGRLTVDSGDRTDSTRFRWRQRGPEISLIIDSRVPGTPELRVEGTESALMLYPPREEPRLLNDPENELSAMFGWWLPVTSLEHWLVGSADPDFPYERLDLGPSGTLAALRQRDWRIRYEGYRLVDGLLVPSRLTFRHASLELTLSVTDFSPVAAEAAP
jgi:outer membrane lipoprotein LolB